MYQMFVLLSLDIHIGLGPVMIYKYLVLEVNYEYFESQFDNAYIIGTHGSHTETVSSINHFGTTYHNVCHMYTCIYLYVCFDFLCVYVIHLCEPTRRKGSPCGIW